MEAEIKGIEAEANLEKWTGQPELEKGAAPRHILVDAAFRKRESIAPCNRA